MMEDLTRPTRPPSTYFGLLCLHLHWVGICFYDHLIQRRQDKVMATAPTLVSSLFPSNVRDRILKDAEEQAEQDMLNRRGFFGAARRTGSRLSSTRRWRERSLRYETDR
jgi:hypothetical protein